MSPSRPLPARAFDVVAAAVLLVLALPLMAVLAVAVAATSHGGVLHRELRRSADGRTYEALSFRTTLDGAATAAHAGVRAVIGATAVPHTGVGELMRATRTHRLPRLFNVLAGDVGLFG